MLSRAGTSIRPLADSLKQMRDYESGDFEKARDTQREIVKNSFLHE